MRILRTLDDLKNWRDGINESVGFVPTMGALHKGHLSLCRKAKKDNRVVIASVFVNPTQFAPNEDFDSYPRTLDKDSELLKSEGIDAVWAPASDIMYPDGFVTTVHLEEITQVLEGEFRPTHFDGVTTVVAKLFGQVRPTRAYFGEKDYQQLQIIRRMTTDLNIATQVVGCPIIRDDQGLALSTRNAYLSEEELNIARQLNVLLKSAKARVENSNIEDTEKSITEELLKIGFNKIDYVAIRNAENLQPVQNLGTENMRILAAAFLNKTRLIDNMPL